MVSKTVTALYGNTFATPPVHYLYDLRGLQIAARYHGAAASNDGVTNVWDGFGRLASSSTKMDGTSRTLSQGYDREGNRLSLQHADGKVFHYGYDGLGRTASVAEPAGASGFGHLIARYWYGKNSKLRSAVRGADIYGYSTSFHYDGAGRASSMHHTVPDTFDLSLGFGYNPASQIVSQERTNDAFSWTGHYNVTRGYTTNGLNQYAAAGPATFGYDPRGNLVQVDPIGYEDQFNLYAYVGNDPPNMRDPTGKEGYLVARPTVYGPGHMFTVVAPKPGATPVARFSYASAHKKIIAPVCHGPAALLAANDDQGNWLFSGRRMTAFSDEEEVELGTVDNAPWLLANTLREKGAQYDKAPNRGPYIVEEGNLLSGQNPASSLPLAAAVLERFR